MGLFVFVCRALRIIFLRSAQTGKPRGFRAGKQSANTGFAAETRSAAGSNQRLPLRLTPVHVPLTQLLDLLLARTPVISVLPSQRGTVLLVHGIRIEIRG